MEKNHFENEINGIIKNLIEGIKSGSSEEFKNYLKSASMFHKYSFQNAMIIRSQMPNATRVAGFRTWKKLGRFVNKGEKAIKILAPRIVKAKDEDESESRVIGFRVVNVFDISQTSGEDLPSFSFSVNSDDHGDSYEALKELIEKNYEIKVEELELGGIYGFSRGGYIGIDKNISNYDKFLTLIHELSHELLHQGSESSKLSRSEKECQAESATFIVANYFGIEAPLSTEYLLSYGVDEKMFLTTLEGIQKASREIINLMDELFSSENSIQEIQEVA